MRLALLAVVLSGGALVAVPPQAEWIGGMLEQMAASLPFLHARERAPSYATAPVERGDVLSTVEAAGTLNALVVVDVGSQISGLVTELYADFNSEVTAGEVIARVDPEIYESRVVQAEAELEMATAQVAVERAQLARAQAELGTAQSRHASARARVRAAGIGVADALHELERKRALAKRNVVAAGELDRAENAHKSAEAQESATHSDELSEEANIQAARAAVATVEARLAQSLAQRKQREALLRQAQIDFERTYIRAPVTGTVVDRAVSGGQTLAASLQSPVLFTIARDLTRMQVEASVVEADISRFAVGQPVTFAVDAHPDRVFAGAVRQIRQAPQIVQNVVTYKVVIDAGNPDGALMPGMTATLRVTVADRRNVLRVPNAALRFDPEGAASARAWTEAPGADADATAQGVPSRVFTLSRDGAAEAVPVRLGITDGRTTEIVSGNLKEGQLVITDLSDSERAAESRSPPFRFRLR